MWTAPPPRVWSCFALGGHNILLRERKEPIVRTPEQNGLLHHAFDVSPEMFDRACKLFRDVVGISIRNPSIIALPDFLPAGNSSFSIPAEIASSSAIPRGRQECRQTTCA
jgi:hypothetical protein